MDQHKIPLYEKLLEHQRRDRISLHVPGHKNGKVMLNRNEFFKQIVEIDMTELEGLDDLHFPTGVILEAECLLTSFYETKKSFFLVNGSTVGTLASILGMVREGDIVFVQRNCHKSVLNGVKLRKAKPVFLQPEFDHKWMVANGVSIETMKEAYRKFPNVKGIFLTYPNYYGTVFPLEEIIQFAHEHGIPVFVDEAHGAHFKGGDYFPPSALELGADVVVQSAHKTLPAMTMGSYLHVNSDRVSIQSIHQYLTMLQSSSPSYPIMASLDMARSYLATYTEEDQQFLKGKLEKFRFDLNQIKGVNVLESPFGWDPLKVTIQPVNNSGYEFMRLLEKKGIYAEMADPYNVLFVMPLLKQGMEFPFEKIVDIVQSTAKEMNGKSSALKKNLLYNQNDQKKKISTIVDGPYKGEKFVKIEEAVGHICGETIIPYPPGIPLFLEGEVIEKEDLINLRILLQQGAQFQGGEKILQGEMKIYI